MDSEYLFRIGLRDVLRGRGTTVIVALAAVLTQGIHRAIAQCSNLWLNIGANNKTSAWTQWDPDGSGPLKPHLVLGGAWTSIGGVGANRVAMWNGVQWSPLGDGIGGYEVNSLATFRGQLFAGGGFWTPASGLARWNGVAWVAPEGWEWGTVRALCNYAGGLVVGGQFDAVDGRPFPNIAKWDGVAWTGVGQGPGGIVFALAEWNGDLLASCVSTSPSRCWVTRWNGSEWNQLGSDFDDSTQAIVVYRGDPIAAGYFRQSPARHVARWDGSAWQPVGGGTDGIVWAMCVLEDDLILAGNFASAGGALVNQVAAWDGLAWRSLHNPMPFGGWCAAPYAGEVIVGGWLYPSGMLVRCSIRGEPWIAQEPVSIPVLRLGQEARFVVTAAVGYTDLMYQWRRVDGGGIDLIDGESPSGSVVMGARTSELTIANLGPADRGAYVCVVSNACGSIASEPATLGVCAADFDVNLVVAPADISLFVATWFRSRVQGDLDGDYDGNQQVEPADVAAFVADWTAAVVNGC